MPYKYSKNSSIHWNTPEYLLKQIKEVYSLSDFDSAPPLFKRPKDFDGLQVEWNKS